MHTTAFTMHGHGKGGAAFFHRLLFNAFKHMSRKMKHMMSFEKCKCSPAARCDRECLARCSGCVIHGNITVAELAASKVIDLEPNNTGKHVMSENIYISTG